MLIKILITVLGLLLASCSTAEDSSSTRSAPLIQHHILAP